ncbi:SCO family protein [Novipirellula aureliae]|nr:SCO family protein [Novipirellula aureliae]
MKRNFGSDHFSLPMPIVVCIIVGLSFSGLNRASAQTQLQDGADVQLNNSLPPEAVGITVDQNLGNRIPLDLALTDSLGRQVTTGDFFDGKKPTIVTLNYSSCPMLCSVQLNALTTSLNELKLKLGEDFRILTVSIDPAETPEIGKKTKNKYIEQLSAQPGADEGWEFCTATQPVITRLADILGFRYRYDEKTGEYNHPAMLAFVSPEGVISRYSLSIDFPPDQLKLALVEAGEGSVGSPVDQFILWCYSYDSSSNSYTPQAWRMMRAGGALTIVVMLVCLTPYWFGRLRAPKQARTEHLA